MTEKCHRMEPGQIRPPGFQQPSRTEFFFNFEGVGSPGLRIMAHTKPLYIPRPLYAKTTESDTMDIQTIPCVHLRLEFLIDIS